MLWELDCIGKIRIRNGSQILPGCIQISVPVEDRFGLLEPSAADGRGRVWDPDKTEPRDECIARRSVKLSVET